MKKKYNYIKKIRTCIIATMLSAGLILTSLTQGEVFAGTKATTPMQSWRYAKKTANYQVNSTSKKYKDIWASATDKWCNKGFKWTKKDSSKTKLSSYYDDSKQGLKIAGKLKKIKVKYDKKTDKIVISGKVKRAKKVVAKYNGVKKTVKVNAKNKFKIEYKYSSAKKITLYGVNNKNKKITKKKSIETEKYVTETPTCRKIIHNKKGITYELDTVAGATLTVKNKGKVISKEIVDTSLTKFFISSKSLKGMSGKISFTQEAPGKKVSKKASYKIINKGNTYVQTY